MSNNFTAVVMSDKIQVAIKVRPLVTREKDIGEFWRVNGNELYLLNNDKQPSGEIFAYDHVFANNSTNMEVFEKVVKPLVNRAVRGFNATIFAYGQTSSGKTHTMLGDQNEAGITQLAVSSMFDFMKKSEGREFLVRASYMEIYNEKVNDLLEQQNNNLKIREEEGKIVVQRLKEELVADTAKVMSLLKRGQKIRRIGETNLNERSSRSHTIFRLLNLVDLAGSERAGLAGTTGERLKEGCAINRSLFQLSQVVAQLSEGSQFVNFRDSKLTRILQCSLGGNAHTLIICTVTPASVDFTLSTLGFASRAKAVKNKPQVNEVMSDGTLIKKYARQLEKLQAELKPRFNRRRTWGGGQLTPLDLLKGNLVTIAEEDTSLVLTNDDFNTPYEDFEVQLIEDEREKGIEMDILPNSESPINLGNSSFGSSIPSTRASRNFSLSTYEECKEIQTSASIMCTPVRHHMATNTTPPSANSLYWTKENKEHRSFIGHENDLIFGLENQVEQAKTNVFALVTMLELKEKELEVLQKSLSEKEEILKNTLSFQESLTMKLVEYEQALEKTHKVSLLLYTYKHLDSNILEEENCQLRAALEKLKQEQVECNEKCVSFQKSMAELELQVEQLKIHNDELKAQFDSVYQEKYSILESYANIKVELAGKNHALSKEDKKTTLENGIDIENEPKEKELLLEEGCSNKCTDMKSVSNDHVQTDPELMDPILTNLERYGQVKSQNSSQEEIQMKYFQEKCREQEETLFVFKEKLKIVENQLNEVNLQNGELKQQINNGAKEKDENVVNLERTLSDKCALEEKLGEQAKIINDIMEANNILELHINANGKDSELEHMQKVCGELGQQIFAFKEKVKVLEDKIEQMSSHNRELVQQIASVEKEKFEFKMKMERTIEEKYALEKKLEQAEVTNNIKEANGALEHNVQTNKKESEHTQKICGDQGELITAFTEKVKILERTKEEKYALEEKLEEQTGIIKEIEEAKRALEQNFHVVETELKEKNKLLLDMETRMCSTLSRNAYCDEYVQTDVEEIEHENVMEKVLLSGCQNKSEKEYEMEPINKQDDQEGKLSTLMEKVNILERQILQDSLQIEELHQQIEKLEKERAENCLALENVLADKCAFQTQVQEQCEIIQEIEKSKLALEMCVSNIESEKKQLLLEILQLRNSNSDECVQMNLLVTSPHNDNIRESLVLDTHNTNKTELLLENCQDKCGKEEKLFAFTEQVRILEEKSRQSSELIEKLQSQIEMTENERVKNSMNLEKVLLDKCSLEERIEEQGLIIKEKEKNNFILQNHIGDLETELKEKKELLLVFQEEKYDLENQLCSIKDKISSSCVVSERAKELETKLNEESECKREKELELAHLQEKLIDQGKQLSNFAANEKVLEDQLQVVVSQKEEMQHKIELLEKNILQCNLNFQNILEDKIALVEKVEELKKIIKDTEESKSTMMICINNLESELMEKKNLLLELQEHKNEIEKHRENLEETVKMKIETLESIKTELENNLKMELEYRIRQDKCISQYENELIELKHKLSASDENLKVLEDELQKEVLINKDMKSQINELEKCKVECEIKLKRTVEEKQILEKRIGEQISDFEESKTSFQQCVNNLEKELNAKKVIILGMEKQNSELQDRHAILETQIENVEKEKLELEDKLKEISNTKSEVERELAFTQKKLLEKESLFNDLLQEGKDLEEQFKKEKELKKEMQKQLTALMESKSNCEEQLNIEIEQRENITSKLNEVTCRCTQQEITIKELENNKASIEDQLQVLENYRSMEEVVKILKIQHNEEVICRENMKKELMSKEEELVQCKRQIQELNNLIDSLEFDNRVRDTQYNSQLQNLEEERMKLVETSKAQSKLESKLKDEVQCLQEQLSKQEEQLKKVKEQLQISINVTIKDNVIKQELLSQIQSLEDEKKEYELRLKKVTDERKQLQFRLSDLDKRAAQQDERAKECEEAQVDLAEMLQFRESKISWDGNKYVKEIELKEISDSRKSPPMQSKYTRHNFPLHNNKKQLIDEIEAKTDLENKLLIMQNELTAAKNSEQELHQEKEKINKENIFLRECVKDLDTKFENQCIENISLRSTLKTLFRIFRGVVREQESPVEKLNSIICHLRTHGISVPSESTFEKEKLESKIAELEKTVESLHETLRREGYHYSSPHWIRMGEWAISNRKMKQLEKKNQELQEEVEKLKSNKGSPASDQGLLDDTLFGKCLKSPKSPVCMKCEELKKQVALLKEESAMKSMRITSLTYDLKCGNLEFFKNKAEDLDQKSNNKRLRHDLEAFEAEAKRRAMKRNQESQTEPSSVPWDRLRAQGTGSKIAEDHVIDKLNETIKRLTSDKEQLKKVARELKRRNQELEVEKQSTSTTVRVSRRASSPVAVTPRRGAALQRLVRDANEIIAVQRQSLHCTHNQRNKENPCPQPERK
ncbi:Kinesin-like protein Klp68D [Gryllus bimaculatus]|nr:Kinesin-like protein Klp68D [Gryllus bimaculatus]